MHVGQPAKPKLKFGTMLTEDFNIAAAVEKMGLNPTGNANGVLRFGSKGSLSVNTSKNTF